MIKEILDQLAEFPRTRSYVKHEIRFFINAALVDIKRNKILSVGSNGVIPKSLCPHDERNITYAFMHDDIISIHAEIDAILKARNFNPKNVVLFIYGMSKAGNVLLTKPCKKCMNVLLRLRIPRIVFSTKTGYGELTKKGSKYVASV